MTNYFLALLGIAIFFIGKYAKRNNKYKSFSFGFWIKDNWPETIVSVLTTLSLMLLFMNPETQFDFSKFIEMVPGLVSLPAKGVASLGAGLFNSVWVYALFKNKVNK